ncbi:MAG: FtsX-like permease family protein [Microcystis sp. M015S2]|jgi:putative ABC transport system permease protein|uniref:ABC transporter permease DevC n=1 Tax=unclassified Microcystis TaxID=2643300 RepID=UPI0022C51691|nr:MULTISPECIES: ABC transporter permease DevC [unclassified Microcystis]MCZ8306445.1 ABC transporter permease DevC [Microcystis sp. LE19-98.1E]MCA2693142.1 FtsX-like permease family protein [Microcystis sp. M034S2]MCA2709148.1 FtsX-like permease family protein [Microcystis sp. M025S2]MCA2744159.1 FtsX-like permease family protein [Microcystis sp. M015S2]MCA2751409.1 FtsX-like permease family protein [Microcystis sp. M144S2]
MNKMPLSWLQLTHNKLKFLVALSGISFAVLLMFMQLGFRSALFESAARLHQVIQGDIVLVSPQYVSLVSFRPFAERRLYQASQLDEVKSISPIYLDAAQFTNPKNHLKYVILTVGIDPTSCSLLLPEVCRNISDLKSEDTVFFDGLSRPEYGIVADRFNDRYPIKTDLGASGGGPSRRVTITRLFQLGPSFSYNGHLITSDLNFLRIFSTRSQKGLISIGVIQLKSKANVQKVIQKIKALVPHEDILILSKQEFIDLEKNHWANNTPIGFIFGLGALLSFVVGTIIVYQVLYTDVSDHLAEYATLKAMGYRNLYLLKLVFQSSITLAILGYIPGLVISWGLYDLAAGATKLPIYMNETRILFLFCLTIIMCCLSGAIAVNKLRYCDPSDIF